MHRLLERLDRRPAHARRGRGRGAERPGDGSGGRPRGRGRAAFAHASEAELARILDFYAVRWAYEPDTFPILWNLDGDVIESFSPDFYLPDLDLYVELTTLKQRLVRKKNRKLRRLRELYPDVRIKLFYARDFRPLMLKFGRLALRRRAVRHERPVDAAAAQVDAAPEAAAPPRSAASRRRRAAAGDELEPPSRPATAAPRGARGRRRGRAASPARRPPPRAARHAEIGAARDAARLTTARSSALAAEARSSTRYPARTRRTVDPPMTPHRRPRTPTSARSC